MTIIIVIMAIVFLSFMLIGLFPGYAILGFLALAMVAMASAALLAVVVFSGSASVDSIVMVVVGAVGLTAYVLYEGLKD